MLISQSISRARDATAATETFYYSNSTTTMEEGDCNVCMRMTTRNCSICNRDFFCSDSCQEQRSGRHLFACSKRSLTSADYLFECVMKDRIPEEEGACEDFGFSNVIGQERTYLFGLYRYLMLHRAVSAEDMNKWRVEGTLIDNIKKIYNAIPDNARGSYYPWFLQNLYVLERPTEDELKQRWRESSHKRAKPYLDIVDRGIPPDDLKPEAKRQCHSFLSLMLFRVISTPMEVNWYSLGFVTCRGQGHEDSLFNPYLDLLADNGRRYAADLDESGHIPVPRATFTQFWNAYEAGALIELMDSKGLKEERSQFPFLQDFLSVPPGTARPSVWDLKQFLAVNKPIDFPPIPSVSIDYGFYNCNSSHFEEMCTLMEIYKRVLESASPLDLHQACIAGRLFDFASSHISMERQWEPLMRNIYPLPE